MRSGHLQSVDASSNKLATAALPLKIKPGKTAKAVIPLKQIPPLPPGNYTLVAQLTDQTGLVSSLTVGSLTITG